MEEAVTAIFNSAQDGGRSDRLSVSAANGSCWIQAKYASQAIDQKRFTRRRKQRIIWKQNPKAGLSGNHLNRS